MQLLEFKTYEEYYNAQKRTVMKRSAGPFHTWWEFQRICDYLKSQGTTTPTDIIAHGARAGVECDEFKKHFTDLNCFGTDLFPFSGKSAETRGNSDVVECDFSVPKLEWVGKFDAVYSNSLDHARDPVQTLNVWLDQLKPNGFLFLQWGSNHASEKVSKGDCFGIDVTEFCDLLDTVGVLKDILVCRIKYDRTNPLQRRGNNVLVFCVQKREKE